MILMKRFIRYMLFTAASISLAACGSDSNDEPGDKPSVTTTIRSVSVSNGSTIDPIDQILIDYNYSIAIDQSKSATLNGITVPASVNPQNGMQMILSVSTIFDTEYKLVVPAGMVYVKDNPSATYDAVNVTFRTTKPEEPVIVEIDNLTNPNATPEAKALYDELRTIYGKKIYSGAMGGVAWETGFTDYISDNNNGAGYPKVIGFDYIHLPYSPSNWIDYGDITVIKDAWDQGSIPAITWHWRAPDSKSGELDFYKDGTDFSASKALTAGTSENDFIESDIEKLAGYLKLVEDAGIPVLFRPFHEAAGDYTWGAWFWWGNEGVEVTKQMWNYLRDKLEKQYGLNNLIWVWTVQTSDQGKLASMSLGKGAYPGNDVVDIIGTDLYPENIMTDQTVQFNYVKNVADGHKMVALTEVGNMVDFDKAAENDALWLYFMSWYDMDNSGKWAFNMWNYQKVGSYGNAWEAVMKNPLVINR